MVVVGKPVETILDDFQQDFCGQRSQTGGVGAGRLDFILVRCDFKFSVDFGFLEPEA